MFWISFVIPLYNCEAYIETCLESILQQGLTKDEYEVIVVNDGSTDGGADIVRRYCREHSNISLINKENGGVSSARNRGMEEAKGEYIYFMDADDRLLPNGMRTLWDSYLKDKEHPDMLTFWSRTVDKYYDVKQWEYIRPHKELFRGTFYEYGCNNELGFTVWSRIVANNLIKESNLRFSPYTIGEDGLFIMKLFEFGEAFIVATNLNIYRYVVREQSAVTGINKKHIVSVLESFLVLTKEMRELKSNSIYDGTWIEKSINGIRRQFFTRMLSAPFTYIELCRFIHKSRSLGFYPIPHPQGWFPKFINAIMCSPLLVFLFGFIFRRIFLRYIKPWIKRN